MKKGLDFNLEALRGFCALIVLVHHAIIYSNILSPGYDFREKVVHYTPSGHLMVLIFFMLSGYVIGLTSLNKNDFKISDYLKRRLVRLYPIYIIAILVTVILFAEKGTAIISTLLFSQNLFSNGLEHNNPLWSLNHEVVYYILVIPVLFFKIKPSVIMVLIVILVTASIAKLQFPMIAEGYLIGFLFWITGFALSKIKLRQQIALNITPDKLVSVFFLLLACDFLNAFNLNRIFIHFSHLHGVSRYPLDSMVNVTDLSYFPYCLYAIVVATATNVKWYKFLTVFVYAACWGHLLILITNGSFFKVPIFYVPAFFVVLSTVFLFSPIRIFRSVSLLAKAGGISYALYVMHMPILQFIGKCGLPSGNVGWFFLSFLILVTTVTGIAYLLEKVLQPVIKQFFMPQKQVAYQSAV